MATVMIVDDSGYTRRTHRRIVESAGHTVVEADSGLAALEAFVVHRPDLVLLDLTLEDMGGLEILQKMREVNPDVRVIVVSADVQRTTGQMVADSGASAFLGKPASVQELLDKVRALLEEVR